MTRLPIDPLRPYAKRFDGACYKDFAFEIKATKNGAEFEGYGSVFGNVDSYNEIVAQGAFAESIKEIGTSGRPLPVLWNHNSDEPIGKYLDLVEDDKGLKVRGELLTSSVNRAKEIAAMIEAGIISGLSIGYYVKGYQIDEETRVWTLTKLKLREISVVTFPANDEARIETVKAKLAAGGQLTKREFEKLLRDAGFSKTEALRITRDGYSAYAGERDAADQTALKTALAELRDALSTN